MEFIFEWEGKVFINSFKKLKRKKKEKLYDKILDEVIVFF